MLRSTVDLWYGDVGSRNGLDNVTHQLDGGAVKIAQDVLDHYAEGRERDRLSRGAGRLEELRTTELVARWLPPAPAVVLDVGGAAGRYALPLAAAGYEVHLVDPVPLHVEQAHEASRAAIRPLASVQIGDARTLAFEDGSADAVLLLGPLYHLVDRQERLRALHEARRVLKAGGTAIVAAISRFASTADGIVGGMLSDPQFASIVAEDVTSGVHLNPTAHPGWFATAYFHRPEELAEEFASAGLIPDGPVAVEGMGWLAPDVDAILDDTRLRDRVLEAIRRVEREPALLGVSAHFLIAGQTPSPTSP